MSNSTPSPLASDHAIGRKYGFSCTRCRSRKQRCSGTKPCCESCARAGALCVYKAQDASTARISSALEKSEARVEELEEALRRAKSGHGSGSDDVSRTEVDTNQEDADIGLDHDGNVEYYGATSRFHVAAASSLEEHETERINREIPTSNRVYQKKWLLSNSRFRENWEKVAYKNLSNEPDIDPETAWTLLRIFWTWQAPLHNCVYRQCFIRDMALDGPYFSAFLLNVILAHACRHARADDTRFVRYESGEYFLRKAELLLVDEMRQERPRIPTIQGLLILGGRQCAVGRNSQGWLYTGMAITMLKDLGLHLTGVRKALAETMEPDDVEVRKRLFLSAYAWDKSISLTLGRRPSLLEMPGKGIDILLDDSDDGELWTPWYLEETEGQYPPTTSYVTSTFSLFVEHAQIVQRMYQVIYQGRPYEADISVVSDIDARLRQFHQSLPVHLRVDDVHSLAHCPPPHIFALNIIYHTTLILLYRPFFHIRQGSVSSNPLKHLCQTARRVCTEEAATVNGFFTAYGQTFRFRNQTYLTSYCVYTAATIELLQVKDPDPSTSSAAVERLATTLRMLEVEAAQTPGIRRSIDIIKEQLTQTESRHRRAPDHTTMIDGGSMSQGLHRQPHQLSHLSNTNRLPASPSDTMTAQPDMSTGMLSHGDEPADISLEPVEPPALWLDWLIEDLGGGFVPEMSELMPR